MRRLRVPVLEVVVVLVCVLLAAWCWNHGVRTTTLTPDVADAETVGVTHYSGGWITLAAILCAIAVAVAVDAIARLVRSSRDVPKGGMVGA